MNVPRRALVISLPIGHEQFLVAAQGQHPGDYVQGVVRGRDPEEAWQSDYESVSTALEKLVNVALSLGVQVHQQAGLDALTNSSACEEVILFAHWKGETFSRNDLLCGVCRLLELAEQSISPAAGVIKKHLMTFEHANRKDDLDSLAQIFNRLMDHNHLVPFMPEIIQRMKQGSSLRRALCRDLMDETLAGGIIGGNRLELFDGLHSPKVVNAALRPEFYGTIELAICQSEVLGTYLDHRHGQRVRLIQGGSLIHPIPRCHIVAYALALAVNNDLPYYEARKQTELLLLDLFRRH